PLSPNMTVPTVTGWPMAPHTPPVAAQVTVAVNVTDAPSAAGFWLDVMTVVVLIAAARYGPTNGPPFPVGGAPAGWMHTVLVSASARAMLMRPLPVWSWVPAGSAMRASRPTMMPFVSAGSTAFMKAAAPATIAADAEVPLITAYASPMAVVGMSVAGAAMKTLGP